MFERDGGEEADRLAFFGDGLFRLGLGGQVPEKERMSIEEVSGMQVESKIEC